MGADLRGELSDLDGVVRRDPEHEEVPDRVGAVGQVVDIRTGEPVVETVLEPERIVIDLTAIEAEDAETAHVEPEGRLTYAPRWKLALKRSLDILITAPVIVLLSPVFILLSLAIVTTSRGPVFYSQNRVGKDGKLFRFYKFRSMRKSADYEKPELVALNEAAGPIFKIRNDPRITRVGRMIRRLSLDELPQLFHVVSGKMTLVGPRPHLPEEVAAYTDRERRRLTVKPGITCIWQVSGRADIDFDQWIEMDLRYIDEWSLGLDMGLLARTIPAVLTGRGAY